MTESNPSTRRFPREMSRPSLTIDGPYTAGKKVTIGAEVGFWFCVVMAFAAGFLTAILLGVK